MCQIAIVSSVVGGVVAYAKIAERHGATLRGRGFVFGLAFDDRRVAAAAARAAFERGVVIETAGAHDEVLKFLGPLTIGEAQLCDGLNIVAAAVADVAPLVRSAARPTKAAPNHHGAHL